MHLVALGGDHHAQVARCQLLQHCAHGLLAEFLLKATGHPKIRHCQLLATCLHNKAELLLKRVYPHAAKDG